MKKDKLNTKDGSEFTVFYLGESESQIKKERLIDAGDLALTPLASPPDAPLDDVLDMDHSCPVGEAGEAGETGETGVEKSDFAWEPNKGSAKGKPFEFDDELKNYFNQGQLFFGSHLPSPAEIKKAKSILLESLKKHTGIDLDDTIESDIIKEPVVGEIYRVKGLNNIVKFVEPLADQLWKVEINKDTYFYLDPAANMLVKAQTWERDLFNEKI